MWHVRGVGRTAGVVPAMAGLLLCVAPAALAAPGDSIGDVTFPVSGFGVSVGVDCDGNVFYTIGDSQLYKTDKDGNLLAQFTLFDDAINEPVNIDEITWDNSRGVFWGGQHSTNPVRVYRIDPTNGKAVFAFAAGSNQFSYLDGIAYDAADDSLWISGDVSTTIAHHACSDGALIGLLTPLDQNGSPLGSISGVAVGTGDTLYLGRNGAVQIVRVKKSDGTFLDVFTSPSGVRDEGLECDPINFAPKLALWSREFFTPAFAGVYEIEAGSCGCGGAAEPTGACCSDGVEGGCQNGVTEAQCAERSGGWGGVGSSCATIASQDTDEDGINDCDDRPGAPPQEQPEDFVTDFKTNTGQGNPCADCGKMDPLWFLLGLSGYTGLLFVRRWKR